MSKNPLPTPNQMVAYNLRRARTLLGWTQEEAAEKLEPNLGERWSKATFSAAERSVAHPERMRQFSADELVAIAVTFELPVTFFLEPAPPQTHMAPRGSDNWLEAHLVAELEAAGPKRIEELEEARAREWNT